jgi:hypothetical protein
VKRREKLYRFHVENLRAIDRGLAAVLASARLAIAQRRDALATTYVCLYALLMGAWAECRLMKLLYEPSAFSAPDRERILDETSLDRWLLVVETAFRRHHNIPLAELKPPALAATAFARMEVLKNALSQDLQSVITLRNKLAHGQWRYPLNEELDDIARDQMDALRKENILSLKQKAALIESICDSIHDLVVSQPTFDRDFDDHFRRVEQVRTNVSRKSYSLWTTQIQARYEQGRREMRRRLTEGGA